MALKDWLRKKRRTRAVSLQRYRREEAEGERQSADAQGRRRFLDMLMADGRVTRAVRETQSLAELQYILEGLRGVVPRAVQDDGEEVIQNIVRNYHEAREGEPSVRERLLASRDQAPRGTVRYNSMGYVSPFYFSPGVARTAATEEEAMQIVMEQKFLVGQNVKLYCGVQPDDNLRDARNKYVEVTPASTDDRTTMPVDMLDVEWCSVDMLEASWTPPKVGRYRMRMVFDTPEGVVTGPWSVVQVLQEVEKLPTINEKPELSFWEAIETDGAEGSDKER